jgi:hypothetical protein
MADKKEKAEAKKPAKADRPKGEQGGAKAAKAPKGAKA